MPETTLVNKDDFPAAGSEQERLRYLLRFAILAPSGHNTQPWRFRVDGDGLHLYADRRRALPVVDPEHRELTMSCGAALEHLLLAARRFGLQTSVELLPDDDADHLAVVRVSGETEPGAADVALFEAMPERRTTRGRFESRPVPDEIIDACRAYAERRGAELAVITRDDDKAALATLVAEGDRSQFSDPGFRAELASWIRSRRSRRQDGLSGDAFGMPDLLSPLGALVVRSIDMGKGVGEANAGKIRDASPALAVLGTAGDAPADWLAGGRALAGVLLTLAAAGATAAYLNEPIEVDALRPRLKEIARIDGVPQLLMRIGYASPIRASARRPVTDVLD